MNSTCLIPLRAGSKRLKNKNIIDFNGSPIFTFPLATAIESKLFDKIILAIDSEYEEMVEEICSQYKPAWETGCWTNISIFIRDNKNSEDESTLYDLIEEINSGYNLSGNMCILYSTSALTTDDQLRRGKELLKKYNVVFPIVPRGLDELGYDDGLVWKSKKEHFGRASHADSFFWFRLKEVIAAGKEDRQIIHDNNGYIILKDFEACPIHTAEDIEDLKRKYFLMKNYKE